MYKLESGGWNLETRNFKLLALTAGFFCAIILFFIQTQTVFAAEILKNTGLISRNIWYSKDPFYAGDKVRIYSIIFNGSDKDLRGRVNFFDNNSLLCTNDFASLSGKIVEVWCDWVPTSGKHAISIKIINPKASLPGEDEVSITLENGGMALDDRVVAEESRLVEAVKDTKDEIVGSLFGAASGGGSGGGIASAIRSLITSVGAPVGLVFEKRRSEIIDDSKKSFGAETQSSSVSRPKIKSGSSSSLNGDKKSYSEDSFYKLSDNNFISRNLASIRDQFLAFIKRYPIFADTLESFFLFFSSVRDSILSSLKSAANMENKPLGYVVFFFYLVVRFILESPIVLTLLILYIVWKLAQRFFMLYY